MKFLWFLVLSIMASAVIAEDIYQYQAANGAMVFTNKPVKNAQKVKLPPISVYASPMTKGDYASNSLTGKSVPPPINLVKSAKIYVKDTSPNIGTNEAGRHQILSDELNSEKQALNDSQSALNNAKGNKLPSEQNNPDKYQARVQSLRDAVTEHQKNIALLSTQLGGNH